MYEDLCKPLNVEKNIRLYTGTGNPALAQRIANVLHLELSGLMITKFANGEIYARFEESVRGDEVFFIQTIAGKNVNDLIMETLIVADAATRASAESFTAVIPHYGYARQDRKASSREPITARLVANLLEAAGVDRVITLDLHSGQIQGFFGIPVTHLTALYNFGDYFKTKDFDWDNTVVVSPDMGRAKVAKKLSDYLGCEVAIAHKSRPKHNAAEVMGVIGNIVGKTCIINDDMIHLRLGHPRHLLRPGHRASAERAHRRVRRYRRHPLRGRQQARLQDQADQRCRAAGNLHLQRLHQQLGLPGCRRPLRGLRHMPVEKPKTHERIIDAAEEVPRGVALLRASLVLLLWALLTGVVVGAGCLATLKVVDLLQEAVWDGLAEALPQPLGTVAPVLLCTLGGVLVGMATNHAGFSLDTLGVVVGHCRTEGGYRVKNWPWALLLFALPIAFGGAVGPEAGVSGFTAALGTMAVHGMRRSGVAVARNASSHPLIAAWKALSPAASDEGRRYARGPRILLWAVAAVGFVFGALGVSRLFGPGAGFPRFDGIDYLGLNASALWVLLALPLGWVLAPHGHRFQGHSLRRCPGACCHGAARGALLRAVRHVGPSQRLASHGRRDAACHLRGKACLDAALRGDRLDWRRVLPPHLLRGRRWLRRRNHHRGRPHARGGALHGCPRGS